MENQKLLFLKNKSLQKKVCLKKYKSSKYYFIDIKDKELSGYCIEKIIKQVNYYIDNYSRIKLPVLIYFEKEIKIIDKLTYIFLECICFYLISDLCVEVHIRWNPQMDIITEGLNSSKYSRTKGR